MFAKTLIIYTILIPNYAMTLSKLNSSYNMLLLLRALMNRKMGRIVEKKNVAPPFPVGFYFFLVFNSVKIS